MTSIHIYKKEQELLNAIADYFVQSAKESIETDGQFNVALSGGNSPKKLYQLLSSTLYKNKVEWKKVNFFFGDERYVPENDLQRNSLMVEDSLFRPLYISKSQIFKVDTTLSPDVAAAAYFDLIQSHFKEKPIQFDLILLGLGDNAHTASLFPFTAVLAERTINVKSVFLKEQEVYRITMTAPLINQSKKIAFLVYGKDKAIAVSEILEGDVDTNKYPAQLINPLNGDVVWFLDEPAASLLEVKK